MDHLQSPRDRTLYQNNKMKLSILASLIASAAAFAPAPQNAGVSGR
jgi:hypothetical protein